jgi:hypothetical protein
LGDDNLDIKRAWESIQENMKTSATERSGYHMVKYHKTWPDKKFSKLLYQSKQAKIQRLQNPL